MTPDMVEEELNWKCPYCGHAQVLLNKRIANTWSQIRNDKSNMGGICACISSITCANSQCRNMSISVNLYERRNRDYDSFSPIGDPIHTWDLLPESCAIPQPDFIPQPLREDYYEACRIRELSPKASATLSRRCLQGMIRDFCEISLRTLDQEIRELRKRVDDGNAPLGVQPDTVEAIDHVRKVGNIGAHMEADINVLVDVDPDEAELLTGLIEMLFAEWYVAKHSRAEKLQKIASLAAEKEAARLASPPKALAPPEGADSK